MTHRHPNLAIFVVENCQFYNIRGVELLCFLWCCFAIRQLVHHPVPVEEIKSWPTKTLCGASLYTPEVLNGDKYCSVSFRLTWQMQKIILDRVKNTVGAFTITGAYYVVVVHVVV